jgi:hypothetical protein
MAEAATGFLHIVRIGGDIDPVNAEYRIAFAPLDGRLRGRQARCEGLDVLTDFLRRAGVPIPEIERTWQALARRRVHSIPRIALTPAKIESLGL